MKRRLTRPEQRERTRSAVLASAARVFLKVGFHRASVDAIAAEAGLTSGAVYSNFATKADLFLAVYEQQMSRWVEELSDTVRHRSAKDRTGAAVDQWLRYARDQQDWFMLFIEFWGHAVKEPALRARFAAQYSRLRTAVAHLIESSAEEFGIDLPLDAGELGLAINALGNGLLLDRLLEPSAVPDDLYGRFLELVFSSLPADSAPSADGAPGQGELRSRRPERDGRSATARGRG